MLSGISQSWGWVAASSLSLSTAERSYPTSGVAGRRHPASKVRAAARRSYPASKARGGDLEKPPGA